MIFCCHLLSFAVTLKNGRTETLQGDINDIEKRTKARVNLFLPTSKFAQHIKQIRPIK